RPGRRRLDRPRRRRADVPRQGRRRHLRPRLAEVRQERLPVPADAGLRLRALAGTFRTPAPYGKVGFWTDAALHVLLPRACAHCRGDLPFRNDDALCGPCAAALPPPPEPACARCAGALAAGAGFCRACAGRLFACRLTRAAASYRGPAASLVRAFKFRGLPSAARAAGRVMAEGFARRPELAGFDALVPVPLHPRRERERGYNQASLLARELAAATALPVRDLLARPRAAAPSWSLRRAERRAELAGA